MAKIANAKKMVGTKESLTAAFTVAKRLQKLQFICKKAPVSCLILLRLNTEALIYRVIANGTHWIGERLFIVFAGRRGFIIDRCCLLAPTR